MPFSHWRTVQRYLLCHSWGWLRLWTWSWFGSHSISLAARYRVAARLAEVLKRSVLLKDTIALLSLLSPVWEQEFLVPSMALTLRTHMILFVVWTVMTRLTKFHKTKSRKAATKLLLDKLHKQVFAGPLACRASGVTGPINRHRVADILPHMKSVSRASRLGILVGFLRILCNGLCTAQRFHTEEHDHICRVGCSNEPDSLSLTTINVSKYNIFLWTCYDIAQRNHVLHDLLTRVFMRSLQCGIVVLGFMHLSMPIISTAKSSRIMEILVVEMKDSLYEGHHSCLRPRFSDNLFYFALAWCPAPKLPQPQLKGRFPYFPMLVP